MKIIHRYVLREHLGPLTFSLSALTFLLLINYIAKRFGELVGKGLPNSVILEFFGLSVPFTVAMTLPMSVLVATLYAFSRLAAENEITALKANGVSMIRLLVPVLISASFLSIGMVAFNDAVLPRANHRLRTLQGDIARKKPTFALREQIINEVSPGKLFLRTNHLDQATGRMREVTIWDLGDQQRRRTIYADSGEMAFAENGSDLLLTLRQGSTVTIDKSSPSELQRLFFVKDYVRVAGVANQLDLTTDDSYKSDREMSICELQNEVSRSEHDLDQATSDLQAALRAAAQEALYGTPATPNIPASAMPPSIMGVPAPPSRHFTLGSVYCRVEARLKRMKMPKFAFVSTALAADGIDKEEPSSGLRGSLGVTFNRSPERRGATEGSSIPQQPDTAKQKTDTTQGQSDTTRKSADSVQSRADTLMLRAAAATAQSDSLARADSIRRDSIRTDSLRRVALSLDSARVAPVGMQRGAVTPFMASAAIETARARIIDSQRGANQYAVELHKKIAISIACVVFVLIGAPIALRFPRGGVGLVIGVSLVVFAIYYVGLIAGEALADRDILTPFWAMWSANIILTLVGLLFLLRMGRESATSRGGDLHEMMEIVRTLFRRLWHRHEEPEAHVQVGAQA